MVLIDSLLSHATEPHGDGLTLEIERLSVAKAGSTRSGLVRDGEGVVVTLC